MEESLEHGTINFYYLCATVTIKKNQISFVDFPNTDEIRKKVQEVFSDRKNYELRSDEHRYRVHLCRQELGHLFTGIEEVYRATHKAD